MLNRRGILAGIGSLVAARFAPAVLDANKITFTCSPIPSGGELIGLGQQPVAWVDLFTASGYTVLDWTGGDLIVTIDKKGVFEVS